MKILITGGAGFIGSALIRHIIKNTNDEVCNLDKLTYAGNLNSLIEASSSKRYQFELADICDANKLNEIFESFQPDVIMHLAAESHVDRSIDGPDQFIKTNILGTYTLLEASLKYWLSLPVEQKSNFRFHHISTDEVYGDLEITDELFTEKTPYSPSSPYSASKASSDHLVRAWHKTFNLPVVITNCSNNYGPYHFPEKLIPLTILNAIHGKPLPVYGNGMQIRDWLYVEDHAKALYLVAKEGSIGETYNIGGHNEKTNIEVVKTICKWLDKLVPEKLNGKESFQELIEFVTDRPGHDQRYAINAQKIERELGWLPEETFETGIEKTVHWYLNNQQWWLDILDGSYVDQRLGLTSAR